MQILSNMTIFYLRHLAALGIFFSHSIFLVGGREPRFSNLTLGHFCLVIFFAMSGYLITKSAESQSSKIFFGKRSLRLMPGLWIYCFFAVFVSGVFEGKLPLVEYFSNPKTSQYFLNGLFWFQQALPGVFVGNRVASVNANLWSLCLEALCYGLIWIIVKILPQILSRILVIAIIIFVFLFIRHAVEIKISPMVSAWLTLIFIFLMGTIFAGGKSIYQITMVLLPAITLVFLVDDIFKWSFLLAFFISLIVRLSNPLCRPSLPDISYGVYLYGFFCQQLVISWLPNFSRVDQIAIGLLITIFISFFSWHCIERPSLSVRSQRNTLA